MLLIATRLTRWFPKPLSLHHRRLRAGFNSKVLCSGSETRNLINHCLNMLLDLKETGCYQAHLREGLAKEPEFYAVRWGL